MTAHRGWGAPVLVALVAAGFSMWSQMTGLAWTDYDAEAAGPMAALVSGELQTFLTTAPAYGGSLLMRSPFAFAADLLGGGEMAVYRLLAVPCLLAAAAFGVALYRMRAHRHPAARWSLVFVALAAGNPVALRALDIGHPEELLGAACCAGAVLAAIRGKTLLVTLLLGIALANKAWAVVAVPVVFVAMPRHRIRAIVGAGALAAVFVVPFLFAETQGGSGRLVALTSQTSTIFQPWQIWWPLGDLEHVVRGGDGLIKADYRYPPEWLGPLTHPLIALVAVPLALLWWRRRADDRSADDVLLLLAMVMLLRCVLDPWNISYYHLPFLFALLAWESVARARPPILSLSATLLVWASFGWIPQVASPDVQALLYLGWTLPALSALAVAAYRLPSPRWASRTAAPAPAR
ncbi:MAG: glycosyltransferase 87 family protein [Solirubrobacteraceae bacterium]